MKRLLAVLLILTMFVPSALADKAKDISKKCTYKTSEQNYKDARDGSVKTGWMPKNKNAKYCVRLPKDGAGWLSLSWLLEPTDYTFLQYDANGKEIDRISSDDIDPAIRQLLKLENKTRYVVLRLGKPGQSLVELRVLSKGDLSRDEQQWDFCRKCDLMLVSAHEDDEWLWFGGLMPYYQYVQHKEVQVVYMADCGRLRREYALNGLWAGGIRNYPCFLNMADGHSSSLQAGLKLWGGRERALGKLVAAFRKYKPEVVVTHALDGEYGHDQHILTSKLMEYAIEAAADPKQYPDSAKTYGAWQVKKLYRHSGTKDQIKFEWSTSYEELYGWSPLKVAKLGFSKHGAQQNYYKVENHGAHDNAVFGLDYSTVGHDELHDDMFEHIAKSPVEDAFPTEPLY